MRLGVCETVVASVTHSMGDTGSWKLIVGPTIAAILVDLIALAVIYLFVPSAQDWLAQRDCGPTRTSRDSCGQPNTLVFFIPVLLAFVAASWRWKRANGSRTPIGTHREHAREALSKRDAEPFLRQGRSAEVFVWVRLAVTDSVERLRRRQ